MDHSELELALDTVAAILRRSGMRASPDLYGKFLVLAKGVGIDESFWDLVKPKSWSTMMTHEMWNNLTRAIEAMQDAPLWLKRQCRLSWEAASRLPQLDSAVEGQDAISSVERKLVSAEFLSFLLEQIAANARGPEWIGLLCGRLAALEQYVGRELLLVTFHFKPHSAMLRIDPDTRAVVHMESI